MRKAFLLICTIIFITLAYFITYSNFSITYAAGEGDCCIPSQPIDSPAQCDPPLTCSRSADYCPDSGFACENPTTGTPEPSEPRCDWGSSPGSCMGVFYSPAWCCYNGAIPPSTDLCCTSDDQCAYLGGDWTCTATGSGDCPSTGGLYCERTGPRTPIATPMPGSVPAGLDGILCSDNVSIDTAIGCIPFKSTSAMTSFLLRWGMGIGGGIAFLLVVVAGFQIITSTGDPKKLQAGKELLTSAIVGLLLIVFSIFILRVIGVDILGIFQ